MAKTSHRAAARAGRDFVAGVLERLGQPGVRVVGADEAEGTVVVRLGGDLDELRRNRELLGALEQLASQVVGRAAGGGRGGRCLIDLGGELSARRALFEGLADEVAEVVARTGRRAVIEALTPAERRMVHTALLEDERVATRSEGDEDHRALFVEPKA